MMFWVILPHFEEYRINLDSFYIFLICFFTVLIYRLSRLLLHFLGTGIYCIFRRSWLLLHFLRPSNEKTVCR